MESVVVRLWQAAGQDLERTQQGIIVLDEVGAPTLYKLLIYNLSPASTTTTLLTTAASPLGPKPDQQAVQHCCLKSAKSLRTLTFIRFWTVLK